MGNRHSRGEAPPSYEELQLKHTSHETRIEMPSVQVHPDVAGALLDEMTALRRMLEETARLKSELDHANKLIKANTQEVERLRQRYEAVQDHSAAMETQLNVHRKAASQQCAQNLVLTKQLEELRLAAGQPSKPYMPPTRREEHRYTLKDSGKTLLFYVLPSGDVQTEKHISVRRHGNLLFFSQANRIHEGGWPHVMHVSLLDVIYDNFAVFFLSIDESLSKPREKFPRKRCKCDVCDAEAEYYYFRGIDTYKCPLHLALSFVGFQKKSNALPHEAFVALCRVLKEKRHFNNIVEWNP